MLLSYPPEVGSLHGYPNELNTLYLACIALPDPKQTLVKQQYCG